MLSEDEFYEVVRHSDEYNEEIMARVTATGLLGQELFVDGWLPKILLEYKRLTGVHEKNINAIWHHRISIYGGSCRHCGEILRTPHAMFCFLCHQSQEDDGAVAK